MSNSNLTQTNQKPKFSVAITTKGYQNLINNTLGDPNRAKRFVASITSAVAIKADAEAKANAKKKAEVEKKKKEKDKKKADEIAAQGQTSLF